MDGVIDLEDLAHTEHSHEFVGADHGEVPFSVILVHSAPGTGPKLHKHPYVEVFFIASGEATFQLDAETIVAAADQAVVAPPNVPHGFTNTGSSELRLTAIHGSPEFNTEWLSGIDAAWIPQPTE